MAKNPETLKDNRDTAVTHEKIEQDRKIKEEEEEEVTGQQLPQWAVLAGVGAGVWIFLKCAAPVLSPTPITIQCEEMSRELFEELMEQRRTEVWEGRALFGGMFLTMAICFALFWYRIVVPELEQERKRRVEEGCCTLV